VLRHELRKWGQHRYSKKPVASHSFHALTKPLWGKAPAAIGKGSEDSQTIQASTTFAESVAVTGGAFIKSLAVVGRAVYFKPGVHCVQQLAITDGSIVAESGSHLYLGLMSVAGGAVYFKPGVHYVRSLSITDGSIVVEPCSQLYLESLTMTNGSILVQSEAQIFLRSMSVTDGDIRIESGRGYLSSGVITGGSIESVEGGFMHLFPLDNPDFFETEWLSQEHGIAELRSEEML